MNTQSSKTTEKYQHGNKNVTQNSEFVFCVCLATGKDINYFHHFVLGFCKEKRIIIRSTFSLNA
jgi:hypothetical protein